MISIEAKIIAGLLGGALLIGALWSLYGWIHHNGYVAGQAERQGYYAPLMLAAEQAKNKANARAEAAERRAAAITEQSEKDYAILAKALADRVTDANVRIADILRRAAADRAAQRCQMPAMAGSTAVPSGPSASDERDQRFSGRLAGVGGRCEHDAAEVAGWQRWYAEQRANASTVTP